MNKEANEVTLRLATLISQTHGDTCDEYRKEYESATPTTHVVTANILDCGKVQIFASNPYQDHWNLWIETSSEYASKTSVIGSESLAEAVNEFNRKIDKLRSKQ